LNNKENVKYYLKITCTTVSGVAEEVKYEGKSVNKSQKAMKKILSEIFT
jgi:hypothetical protein